MSKNVVYYDFFPTKAQEEGGSSNTNTHGGVVEIRTEGLPSNDSWSIRRMVGGNEISSGKLMLEYHEKLDSVYISRGGMKAVSSPVEVYVLLSDVTEDPPVNYETSLKKAPKSVPFTLIWSGVVGDRRLKPKDEIEIDLSCDASGTFQLKLLRLLRRA